MQSNFEKKDEVMKMIQVQTELNVADNTELKKRSIKVLGGSKRRYASMEISL